MTDPVHPESGSAPFNYPQWLWREPSRGEHFRTCTWCGSIHPEDLAAESDWHADWADRKYGWPHKFYVNITNREPDALFVTGGRYGGSAPIDGEWPSGSGNKWYKWEDLTPELLSVTKRDGYTGNMHPDWISFSRRSHHWGKFYSVHLADPTIDRSVIDAIEQKSGLHFEFSDGRVRWWAYE